MTGVNDPPDGARSAKDEAPICRPPRPDQGPFPKGGSQKDFATTPLQPAGQHKIGIGIALLDASEGVDEEMDASLWRQAAHVEDPVPRPNSVRFEGLDIDSIGNDMDASSQRRKSGGDSLRQRLIWADDHVDGIETAVETARGGTEPVGPPEKDQTRIRIECAKGGRPLGTSGEGNPCRALICADGGRGAGVVPVTVQPEKTLRRSWKN
jgi:hypothetical protein